MLTANEGREPGGDTRPHQRRYLAPRGEGVGARQGGRGGWTNARDAKSEFLADLCVYVALQQFSLAFFFSLHARDWGFFVFFYSLPSLRIVAVVVLLFRGAIIK